MSGPTFFSNFAFGQQDSQSQFPLGISSLFTRNCSPYANSNASSFNRTPLGTSALYGKTARPSSATPQIAATSDASQTTQTPIERESGEDLMDNDATHFDPSKNQSEIDFGDEDVLFSAKLDTILGCVLKSSSDAATANIVLTSSVARVFWELLAGRIAIQDPGDNVVALKATVVSLEAKLANSSQFRPAPGCPVPAQTYEAAAQSAPSNPTALAPPKAQKKNKAKSPALAKSPYSRTERQVVLHLPQGSLIPAPSPAMPSSRQSNLSFPRLSSA